MTYDYIIIGAGAAGLLLADAMGKDYFFKEKSILLLDKDAKKTNDRTWCFWEKDGGDFEQIIHRRWDHIYFGGKQYSRRLAISPYSYKMIRGIDFYAHYLNKITSYKNITFLQTNVKEVTEIDQAAKITTEDGVFKGKQVFNSVFNPGTALNQQKYPMLQQHFVGWFVKTKVPIFDSSQATFMDFSIPQKGNTRFMYVLPFSQTEALVEYTLFSKELLPESEYEEAISQYIAHDLNCSEYRIVDKEKGNIPMTCYDFSTHNTQHIFHIGTAGGWAKPSTGYTFMNTSKKIKHLVQHIKKGGVINLFPKKDKFWYYDLLLLDVLHHDNSKGRLIFETLFRGRSPQEIFKFLDEETSFSEDLRIIGACPKWEFITALFRRLFYTSR